MAKKASGKIVSAATREKLAAAARAREARRRAEKAAVAGAVETGPSPAKSPGAAPAGGDPPPLGKAKSLLDGRQFSLQTSKAIVACRARRIAGLATTSDEVLDKEREEGRGAKSPISTWASKTLAELGGYKSETTEKIAECQATISKARKDVRDAIVESDRLIRGEDPTGTIYEGVEGVKP